MAEHPNLELFRGIHAAFDAGDMETLATFFADDTIWHTPGNNPLSGDFHGRDAVFESFAKEFELSDGTYSVAEVHDVLANDEHIVALLRATARLEEKALDSTYAIVFNVTGGKITEAWELPTDQDKLDEFWS